MAPAQTPKLELVDDLARRLEARFGPGILYRLARARPKLGALAVSSGSLRLDHASGVGGLPRGRLSLLRGGESSGKTTLAYHLLASAQAEGGLAALIDGEGAADERMLTACGVDLEDLILASPRDATEALEMIEILVRCRALDAVVATALPAARPASGGLDRGLRRLNAWLNGAPTAVVLVGDGLSEVGGPAHLRRAGAAAFFASLIVELRLIRPIFGPGGDLVGLRTRAEVVKNRLASPGGVVELEVLDGRGLRRATELLELGLERGLVTRGLQGLVWERTVLGRGPAAALALLEADPALAEALASRLGGGSG